MHVLLAIVEVLIVRCGACAMLATRAHLVKVSLVDFDALHAAKARYRTQAKLDKARQSRQRRQLSVTRGRAQVINRY